LLVSQTGVINVHAVSRRKEITYMKTFTIDADNNITVHASRKAARETGLGAFATEEQFADLIGPDNKRLVEIWNGITGVKPVTKFANRKSATERIWKAIQSLGETSEAAAPESNDAAVIDAIPAEFTVIEPEVAETEVAHDEPLVERPTEDAALQAEIEPVALTASGADEATEPAASAGAPDPQGSPEESPATEKATPTKKAPKAKKAPKPAKLEAAAGPREGSKTARVVAMLKREGGATLEEIMQQMSWQKHTVRGFMAGAMKKAGFTVESFKSEKGERSYRINQ
jgi:hypothetical protein